MRIQGGWGGRILSLMDILEAGERNTLTCRYDCR